MHIFYNFVIKIKRLLLYQFETEINYCIKCFSEINKDRCTYFIRNKTFAEFVIEDLILHQLYLIVHEI